MKFALLLPSCFCMLFSLTCALFLFFFILVIGYFYMNILQIFLEYLLKYFCFQYYVPGSSYTNQNQIKKFYLKSVHFITVQHKLSRAFQTDMHNK